jgi:hypothetical protein
MIFPFVMFSFSGRLQAPDQETGLLTRRRCSMIGLHDRAGLSARFASSDEIFA